MEYNEKGSTLIDTWNYYEHRGVTVSRNLHGAELRGDVTAAWANGNRIA